MLLVFGVITTLAVAAVAGWYGPYLGARRGYTAHIASRPDWKIVERADVVGASEYWSFAWNPRSSDRLTSPQDARRLFRNASWSRADRQGHA